MLPVTYPRPEPLVPGTLLQRYKRFLADIRLDTGEVITAHCVNTGAMEGLTAPGLRVWVSRASNPSRKLAYTWELAEVSGRVYGVDTSAPNRIVRRLLEERRLSWLAAYPEIVPERRYPDCNRRADFWLCDGQHEVWLEVKNCHLVYPDGIGYFPDCVSARAAAHMAELCLLAGSPAASVRAEVLFCVQVSEVQGVRPSDLHDPTFAAAAREAARSGVRFSALAITQTPRETRVERLISVDLEPYPLAPLREWRGGGFK